MELFDSHCHLDFPVFDVDRVAVLKKCWQQGLRGIVVPAVSRVTWARLQAVVESEPQLFAAYGLHPMFLSEHQADDVALLREKLVTSRAVAVGEFGLDFFLPDLDKTLQMTLFVQQLDLAVELQLPVILHVRKAHDEVLAQLRQRPGLHGIIHAFSGSEQQAQQYCELGFMLGFGGALSYERAKKLRRLVVQLPLNRIVLETDAPDMLPEWQQDQRNTPENIPRICALIAALRNQPVEDIANQTTQNVLAILPAIRSLKTANV